MEGDFRIVSKLSLASIDFEFNKTSEPKVNLVCCSIKTKYHGTNSFWLHDGKEVDRLKHFITELSNKDYIFLSYAVEAEARSFLSLNLEPLDFKWIDLYLEYRCILNHNDALMYGNQLKKGRIVKTKKPKPKWERSDQKEDREENNSKPSYGLSAAVFNLLKINIDEKHKNKMRDLIISAPEIFSEEDRESIIEYCESDVEHLEPLFDEICKHYRKLLHTFYRGGELLRDMIRRAEYSCRTAKQVAQGYPINLEKTKKFSDSVPSILFSCQREIIDLFPENPPFYKFKRKSGVYTLHQRAVRKEISKWLAEGKEKKARRRWLKTEGGKTGNKQHSLSLKAFQRNFDYTHNYPKDNYFAQMIRFLKLKQNLNGFSPTSDSSIWDYVGSDGYVRPYMGIYGAQSSRSQPKATSFIPLKSAWMRYLIEPPKGKALASIDFKSQEFLIAGLLSKDDKMIEDYATGDVYLAFGKSIGYIPKDGTKDKYKKKRDECKPVVLGIQFDMTKIGLSKDLTEKWGRPVSEEEADKWIKAHKDTYSKLWRWKQEVADNYKHRKFIRLPDGWTMWGDNENFRSVGNVPIQGMGACIMRKSVELAQDKGINVMYTLHDAIYIEEDVGTIRKSVTTLAECMDEAFRFYFPKGLKEIATVGLEADIWSPELEEKSDIIYYSSDFQFEKLPMETKTQRYYVDPRGKEELEFFKPYFETDMQDTTDYDEMDF